MKFLNVFLYSNLYWLYYFSAGCSKYGNIHIFVARNNARARFLVYLRCFVSTSVFLAVEIVVNFIIFLKHANIHRQKKITHYGRPRVLEAAAGLRAQAIQKSREIRIRAQIIGTWELTRLVAKFQ
jgi:hypothetical protein